MELCDGHKKGGEGNVLLVGDGETFRQPQVIILWLSKAQQEYFITSHSQDPSEVVKKISNIHFFIRWHLMNKIGVILNYL